MSNLRLIFCCHQPKMQKISHFWHFADHNSGGKHDNETNNPTFFTYSLSFISWYIWFLDFKTFKIYFSLHYVLICKRCMPIYIPKIALSSLLIQIRLFYRKFAIFWYITCFDTIIYQYGNSMDKVWYLLTFKNSKTIARSAMWFLEGFFAVSKITLLSLSLSLSLNIYLVLVLFMT